MHTLSRFLCACSLAVTACGGQPAAEAPAPSGANARPLATLAAQRVIVTPAYQLRETDVLGWTTQISRSREYLKQFDAALASALAARGLKTQWAYPADLVRSMRANPSYAVDPYSLAAGQLRDPGAVAGMKLSDPLVTQLRTMVALHDSRAVLLPVELRFEKDAKGGVAIARLALLDGRLGEVRWLGDVRSDPSTTFSPALLTSLAKNIADLIIAS